MEKGYHTSHDSLDPLFLLGFMNLEKSFFQGEQEFQSPVFSIFCRNVSFMEKNSVLHDGEPQAGTTVLPAASFAYTIETFENPVQVIFFYSLPRVIVGEIIKFLVFHVVVYSDRNMISGVIDGIFNEIPEYTSVLFPSIIVWGFISFLTLIPCAMIGSCRSSMTSCKVL